MPSAISTLLLISLAIGSIHAAPTPKDNTELISSLITTPIQVERYRKLLTESSGTALLTGDALRRATVYDFTTQDAPPIPGAEGGATSTASTRTFPLLINSAVTINRGTVGACGVLLPHVHPRANEFFVVTEGELDTGMVLEAGLFTPAGAPTSEITTKLAKNQGTLFPQGSIHYQVNDSPDCKESVFYAILTSEDAGATPVLKDPLPGNVTVGMGKRVDVGDFETVRAVTPARIVEKVDACRARCHKE